jgi:hypothetical protein
MADPNEAERIREKAREAQDLASLSTFDLPLIPSTF